MAIFWLQTSENYHGRINAKEVLISQKGEEFIFPIADGTAKLSGRDHGARKSTPRRDQPVLSEDFKEDLEGNSETSKCIMGSENPCE